MKITNYEKIRKQLLQWAASFEYCVFWEDALAETVLVGVGVEAYFSEIQSLPQNEWLFGHISYDYKNKLEKLVSEHSETVPFADASFFQPQFVVELTKDSFALQKDNFEEKKLFQEIIDQNLVHNKDSKCSVQAKLSKEEYIAKVTALQKHIQRGDIYEINFCQEFVAEDIALSPAMVYESLVKASPMPFAVFLKEGNTYAFCSSPERYVKKTGNKIISQPIKGTAKRGQTAEEDLQIIKTLQNNPKERAENVMAVDVVRNDLARVAVPGTVEVEELCEIYTFKQLHQMISTVSAILPPDATLFDVVKASFPMASMTGAPKIRAMQLIEEYETSKRGLYSGTIGYLSPNRDFDFNVVIRTILYDAETQKLSFTVGSAITAEADAAQEYEECLLKAQAIIGILSS